LNERDQNTNQIDGLANYAKNTKIRKRSLQRQEDFTIILFFFMSLINSSPSV